MKRICWILIAAICLNLIPCFAEADERVEVCLYDDFEGIQAGRHPLYKHGGWGGDTLRTNYCSYLDVVNTPDSKKLRLHTKGAGEAIGSVYPYYYASVAGLKEDLVFEADFTIENDITVAYILMRGDTSSSVINLIRFEGGSITSEGVQICDYKPGEEYHVIAEMNAKSNTMRVSVNDTVKEDIKMGAPLKADSQAFRFSLDGSSEKGVECGFLIDNVRIYKASEKADEAAFSNIAQNLGLNDWSDLTKFMENNISLVKGSKNAAVGINRAEMEAPALFDGEKVYAPIKFVMESLKIPYKYANGTAEMTFYDKIYTLKLGEGLKLVNAKPYVDLRYLCDFGGLYLTVKNNTAMFGRHLVFFNNDSQAKEIEDFVNGVQEEQAEEKEWFPTKEEIDADFAAHTKGVHPRLLATKDDFDRIRELIKTDAVIAGWYEDIKKKADHYCTLEPFTYRTTDGIRLDTSVSQRFEALGLVYNVEGGEKYFKKAYEDMLTVVQYETWQEYHYILCANMIAAMAIGYDWFYNAMTVEERKTIAEGIRRLGLKYALEGYRRETLPGATDLDTRAKLQWLNDTSNWVAVGNGGNVMGAIALYDEYPEDCNEIIRSALQSMENYYVTTEPDGGNTEGVGYWLYSCIYYIDFVAALEAALGTDYGRYNTGGIDKLGYFPVYMQNEVAAFPFSDSANTKIHTPLFMYFARRNNDNNLGYYRKNAILNNLASPEVRDLLWYRDSFSKPDSGMELDYYFRNVESGSFRDTFYNDFSTFFSFHGGSNGANHSHMDTGTWILNAHGEKWFIDLGKDPLTYANPNGVQFTADQLYRIRAEGHNCMVFNPDASSGQEGGGYGSIESFLSEDEGGFAIMDLQNVYKNHVSEYKRGYMLTDNRTRAIVQDKFTAKKPSEFWWFAHTAAEVEISPDGRRAVLTQGDRKLAVYLSSTDSSLKFGVMDAVPLPTSPNIIGRADDSGIRKLFVHGENVTELEIAVSMVPIIKGEVIPRTAFGLVPLEKWRIKNSAGKPPVLNSMTLDSEEYAEFNPRIYEYKINVPFEAEKAPEVKVEADDIFDVEIKSYEVNLNEKRDIVVRNKNTCEKKTYYVSFMRNATVEIPESFTELVPVSVTASDTPQADYPAEQVLDNDMTDEKRWSAIGDQHLIFDLGEEKNVDGIAIAFMKGTQRLSKFEVYTSVDGENYELVLDTLSCRMSDFLELHKLKKSSARYVKLQLHGSDHTYWNSIKEVKLYSDGK